MANKTPLKCADCGAPQDDHPYRHPFRTETEDTKISARPPKKEEKGKPPEVRLPASEGLIIGLMQVLSAKGILDGDDLTRILTGTAAPRREHLSGDQGARPFAEPRGGSGDGSSEQGDRATEPIEETP